MCAQQKCLVICPIAAAVSTDLEPQESLPFVRLGEKLNSLPIHHTIKHKKAKIVIVDLFTETKPHIILQMWVWWQADQYSEDERGSCHLDSMSCLAGSLTVTQTQSRLHPACSPASQSPRCTRSSVFGPDLLRYSIV